MVGGFAAVAVLSPLCALLTLAIVPPIVLAARWLRRRAATVYPEYRRQVAAMTGDVIETAEAAVTLQAYGAEPARLERLQEANGRVVDSLLAATACATASTRC